MRLLLIALTLLSLPAAAVKAYKDDPYQERFLFGEKTSGRFVMSFYSVSRDTVRFGDCSATTRCETIGRDFHRQELSGLHQDLLAALEKEQADRLQKPHNILAAFFGTEVDAAELKQIIAELRDDRLENWILLRPGNPFVHNFRSKSLYTKIVKIMRETFEKPLPSQPLLEADSGR